MTLPIHIARKLLQMMQGQRLPASSLKHAVVARMIDDNVITRLQLGRAKAELFVQDGFALANYLKTAFSISDLAAYVEKYDALSTRSEAIEISGTSKLKNTRTFTGFLVNSYTAIEAQLNHSPFTIEPVIGSSIFIHDYKQFSVPADVTIVGIENSENFTRIHRQQSLFTGIKPLFVSRYPHSGDLTRWLLHSSHNYLHFGDLDFAGINIFATEFHRHLGARASFLIPLATADVLAAYGNRQLYDKQLHQAKDPMINEEITQLISLMHYHKKVLEQEIFLNANVISR